MSSKLYGRTDIQELKGACRNLLNSIVRPQGGAYRRPGSQYITDSIDGVAIAGEWRLIPWTINKSESYIVAIGTSATASSAIEIYRISDGTWYEGGFINNYGFAVNTWVAYTTAELKEIKFSYYGDRMVIVHPSHRPVILTRMSSTDFLFHFPDHLIPIYPSSTPGSSAPGTPVLTLSNYPFRSMNTNTAHTMTAAATTGSGINLTSSQNFFESGHVGARFRLLDTVSGTEGWCIVVSITNALVAVVNIVGAFGATTATSSWFEQAWSDYRGWPRTVCFRDERIVYGGNTHQPDTLWFSQFGDIFELMHPRVSAADDDAYSRTLNVPDISRIQWLENSKTLFIGTERRDGIIYSSDQNASLAPSNFQYSAESSFGSEYIQPVKMDNAVIFVQREGQKLREMVFNFDENAYKSDDLNFYADHVILKAYDYYATVTAPKFIQLAKQDGDTPIIWALDNNGVLNVLSRDRDKGVMAWTPIKLGGAFGSGEPPVVLSICTVPSVTGIDDELWMLVKRTINSTTKYYIEKITKEFFQESLLPSSISSSIYYPYYMDCAKSQTLGAPGTAFNGFAHLVGETVDVVADGNYIGTKVVSVATITTASNYTTIIAGYSYRNIISPLLPDVGSIIGTAIGAIRRIDKMITRFRRTVAAKFGRSTSAGDLEEINFRVAANPAGDPIDLYDGLKERDFNGDYERDPQIYILNDDPLPMEVTSFSARGITYD